MTDPIETTVGGTTVTIHPDASTPSERLKTAGRGEVLVEDALGRGIRLAKPGVLDQFGLVEALGDTAKNETFMGMALPVLFVTAIDGDLVPKPQTRAEFDMLVKRLDEEGLQAVMTGVQEHFGMSSEDETKKKSAA